jgi:signal transduction histidine kinase
VDLVRLILAEAKDARDTGAFYARVAALLSEWAGGARVRLALRGKDPVETAAGPADRSGHPQTFATTDAEGRRLEVVLAGAAPGLAIPELQAALDVAASLGTMVGRRASLERERRLGTFLVELSRWLLAAPEIEILARYALQSITSLLDAQGAYVALTQPDAQALRVIAAVGSASPAAGTSLALDGTTPGRVVTVGDAVIAAETGLGAAGPAASALLAPLTTSRGAVGIIAVQRQSDTPFAVADLHYLTAVAANIASGVELSTAVQSARVAAQRAHAMVEASPLPLVLADLEGRVRQANVAALRLFGRAKESEILGQHLERLGFSASEITLRLVLEGPRAREPWHGRVLITQPGGDRRTCDCTVTGLSRLDTPDLLVALYDRTDELRLQRDLVTREKLATVGEIASGVAHEVNNPLTAIRMEAELLARARPDPDVTATTAAIVREVDRAARIVRSLLRLSRRSDSAPSRVQLNELLRDVAEIRQRVLRPDNVELRVTLDPALPPALGLAQELQQVLINLVTNAEHAVIGRQPAVIALATRAREGWVQFSVEDSGPGVPEAVRHRIFDPFFTTKGPDEGTGLGLTISQRVVTEVGGKIWLEDSKLGGARFVVELPAAGEATAVG